MKKEKTAPQLPELEANRKQTKMKDARLRSPLGRWIDYIGRARSQTGGCASSSRSLFLASPRDQKLLQDWAPLAHFPGC